MTREILTRSALELADSVRLGEVSSRELVEGVFARLDEVGERVNAFTYEDREGALAAAGAVGPGDERPFAGVPIAVKDLGTATEGMPQNNGSRLFEGYVPDYDGNVARRLRAAGFVIVGRTQSPEMGILPTTEPARFGPARNPWDLERTTGGSSGGSAAAVAAGMVPIAHASDGGGSIRIPAACCGLVGLKPSRGRISRAPEFGDSFLSTDGVVSRTVADTAALLDVLSGYEPGDSTWAPPPYEPFSATAARPPGQLRIGVVTEPPLEADLDPLAKQAARDAADLLAQLGHDVSDAPVFPRDDNVFEMFTDIWAAPVGLAATFGGGITGREPSEENLEPLTWWLFERARENSTTRYFIAMTYLQRLARQIVAHYWDYDVILTPALAERPLPLGTLDPCSDDPEAVFRRSGRFTPYTPVVNVTGQPAISLPVYHGDDDLPLAIQLIGRPLSDGLLLSLSAQLETECGWADRLAPV